MLERLKWVNSGHFNPFEPIGSLRPRAAVRLWLQPYKLYRLYHHQTNVKTKRQRWVSLISTIVLSLSASAEVLRAAEIQVPIAPANARSVLPAIDGAYPVGVRSFSWIDSARSRTGLPEHSGSREISVTVWYPATTISNQKPALYAPGIEEILAAADSVPEDRRGFIKAHEPMLNVASNSIPAAGPAPAQRGWPVIFFSPGGNVSRHFQTALAEEIASRGFVFISMAHPHSSLDVAPDSGFSMSLDWNLDSEDRQVADENDNRLADILAEDAKFVMDQMRIIDRSSDALAVAMNLDRVGIAGHSRGGKTVGRTCATNKDFRACAVIDNIGPARERNTGIEQPFLTLRSDWREDRVNQLHDYLSRTGSISHDILLLRSNHFTCTDIPLFITELRVEGLEPGEGIHACASIITAFFGIFLAGGTSEDADWIPDELSEHVSVRQFRRGADE
jgi:predicted dienelactone hydrolase